MSNHLSAPDFVALSFYKIFGFPDLGALIIRKAVGHVFDKRKYFGGGTTEMTTCIGDAWVVRKESSLHARLEDGTIAFRSILVLNCAIKTHRDLFGGLEEVSKHTGWLAKVLDDRLRSLRHTNGMPVYHLYSSLDSSYGDSKTQGATVAFNVCQSDGTYIGPWHVGALLRANHIHVRTGTVCNPAGISCALGLDAKWLRKAFDEGYRCNTETDVLAGVPVGVVRVTLGAMSTLEDIETLISCLYRNFVDNKDGLNNSARSSDEKKDSLMESKQPNAVAETEGTFSTTPWRRWKRRWMSFPSFSR
ncbi:Molybdenum cofactor sulfurase [Pyrenophora tritici-repentis]|nr:Molybdenum cofactor sulfurase [Pyrenophora tritici-repentis]